MRRCARISSLGTGLVVAAMLSACTGSTRAYERAGRAGAVMFLVGGVLTPVGSSGISRKNEQAGATVAAIGVTSQVVGALLLLWGFDGLIQAGE